MQTVLITSYIDCILDYCTSEDAEEFVYIIDEDVDIDTLKKCIEYKREWGSETIKSWHNLEDLILFQRNQIQVSCHSDANKFNCVSAKFNYNTVGVKIGDFSDDVFKRTYFYTLGQAHEITESRVEYKMQDGSIVTED
jgi:hypothetical protein